MRNQLGMSLITGLAMAAGASNLVIAIARAAGELAAVVEARSRASRFERAE